MEKARPSNCTHRDAERFWKKVRVGLEDECWPWCGALNGSGYGHAYVEGKVVRAHRAAFFFCNGKWPTVCRHSCDNRPCCNPKHLEDGTQADNMADCVARGRHRHGSPNNNGVNNGCAKLDNRRVKLIRSLVGCAPHAAIAKLFGVSQERVSSIIRGTAWKHI